ncbi:MAG: DUF2125 domain-containing protein [Pseudomonadota bacterium]
MLRFSVRILIIFAIVWSVWWVIGQQLITRGVPTWLEDRRAEGWQAEVETSVGGFPATWRATFPELLLADPDTGVVYEANGLRLSAPAYAPTRVTAVWPEAQSIASPFDKISIESKVMRGHLGVLPTPDMTLDASEIALEAVTLTGSSGWTASLDSGSLETARLSDDPLTHDIQFSAINLRPAEELMFSIDPAGLMPRVLAEFKLDVEAGFDRPWDRAAIEVRRPQFTAIDLENLSVQWGNMALEAAGQFTVDETGAPDGRIEIRATNWREMLAVGQATGAVPENLVPLLETLLTALSEASGNPNTLDAPLIFREGRATFGGLPLPFRADLTIR